MFWPITAKNTQESCVEDYYFFFFFKSFLNFIIANCKKINSIKQRRGKNSRFEGDRGKFKEKVTKADWGLREGKEWVG